MKKALFLVVALLILAVAGLPFVSGFVMEQVVRNSFENINQMYAQSGSDLSVQVVAYDRGYASSRIEWKLSLGALKSVYKIDDIIFVDEAKHGMSGIVTRTSLEKNPWFKTFVDTRLKGENPLDITTTYAFSGRIESNLALSAFSFKEKEDLIDIKPARMHTVLDNDLKDIRYDMAWDGCVISEKLKLENLSLNSDMKRMSTYIWQGGSTFGLAHLAAEDQSGRLELDQMKGDITMAYDEAQAFYSVGLGYGIEKALLGTDRVENAFVRVGVNRMSASGYESFMAAYTRIINDLVQKFARANTGSAQARKQLQREMAGIGLQMAGAYEKLLTKDFEIRVSDLRLRIPQGEIKGNAALSLRKSMTLAGFAPVMMNPESALAIFNLESDVSMPYVLIQNNPNMIHPLFPGMQTGLFLRQGDLAVHTAQTRDGKLLLNQNEVVLR